MQTSPQDNEAKKVQVQEYFSRTAENYVSSTTHRTGPDLKRLIELGEWNKQQQALDIATGGGHTALAVALHVAQVTASDLTPKMLEKARTFILAQSVTNVVFHRLTPRGFHLQMQALIVSHVASLHIIFPILRGQCWKLHAF